MTWKPLPRRVLMTADTVGGVWTYVMELADALRREGVEIILATMGALPSESQRAQAAAAGNVRLCESQYALEWMGDPWADVSDAGRWLQALENRHRPDIVHLNGYAHAACSWRAPVVVVGHSCVLSWWQAVKGRPAPDEWDHYKNMVRSGLLAADCIVAPTQMMLDELARCYGPLPAGQVIPNGRDPSRFRPAGKEPFILTVGRLWDEAKNVRRLCGIAADLPWPVKAAGDERAPDGTLTPLANVEALGRCDEASLADLYSRAAIYALPACYEPFGLSALEAGLSGCALVLGDIPSLREVWQDAALYVPPQDEAAWRNTLTSLIADTSAINRLAEAARERALEFTNGRFGSSYLDLYRGLLAAAQTTRTDSLVAA